MSAEDLVALAVSQGGLGNDALLAAVLPLFHATAAVHERGLIAPLRGLDRITVDAQTRLGFDPSEAGWPVLDEQALVARGGPRATAVDVVAHRQSDVDLGESGGRARTTVVEPVPAAITAPVYVAGWQSWEHVVGHHDPLTDIFSLGQLLIGLGCGLDLSRTEDVARLIDARGNLYALDPGLHPVIVSVAAQMAEPDRHRRAQDLHSLIEQLENYRDQPLDFDVEAITQGVADRRTAVLRAPAGPVVRPVPPQPPGQLPSHRADAEPDRSVRPADARRPHDPPRPAVHLARRPRQAAARQAPAPRQVDPVRRSAVRRERARQTDRDRPGGTVRSTARTSCAWCRRSCAGTT